VVQVRSQSSLRQVIVKFWAGRKVSGGSWEGQGKSWWAPGQVWSGPSEVLGRFRLSLGWVPAGYRASPGRVLVKPWVG
jgi:hypothetical protein